jgi:iron complex transport system ATP-binding protein
MTSAGSPVLAIANLTAGYTRRRVLESLTLPPIAAGGITALVGPNGAGKSTLLRALAGLLPATGTVTLDGRDLLRASPTSRARDVAFMPQTLPARVGLTVLESVISAIRAAPVHGLSTDAASVQRRAMLGLERIGLAELALEPLDRLSGGQRQLAGLAQALVRDPALFLLDEPTSSLDLGHQVGVMSLVDELATDGRIVVVVLHDLTLAVRWARRVVVLHRGAVAADGAPDTAVTAATIADVYGVRARVERCSLGSLHVVVDGLAGAP